MKALAAISISAVLLAGTLLGQVWADSKAVDYSKISAIDLVKQTPKGKLHNPYKDTQKNIVAQGQTLFRSYPCSGCHGGDGGGGMCPPVTNSWIYGGDDDTLFRLVTLGSDQLQKEGYSRQTITPAVGPMPSMGPIIKNSDELWKIITFIRSRWDGDPAYKYGAPASAQ
ncbi:MAG TPA: c-type cytochrome [Steroidobacteraceae bacterium]|nr:c-type cytochrome [Steroidobacteraceae bacterium]